MPGIFVAATRQHVGKTSTCLGVASGLLKRYDNVGFMKPVGQKSVTVQTDHMGKTSVLVDKDVPLFKELLGLRGEYADMSPIVIGSGYTRQYLDGKICREKQYGIIDESFKRICATSDYQIVEGTGHCGVGSVVGLNNAQVAKHLNLPMVLVVNGGIGSTFDDFEVNRTLCEKEGAKVGGVIINKVRPDLIDDVRKYMGAALKQYDIPLCGVVPFGDFFDDPAMRDYEQEFDCKLLCGHPHRLRHFSQIELVSSGVSYFVQDLAKKSGSTLWVMHASRSDLILALLAHAAQVREESGKGFQGGLILTGSPHQSWPQGAQDEIMSYILSQEDIPVLYIPLPGYTVVKKLESFTAKLNTEDKDKTMAVVAHYEKYMDFETLKGISE